MWDLHAVTSAGITTIAALTTIMAGGDRATVAGVPAPHGDLKATLMYHGAQTAIADTILEYQLLNNDMSNPRQGFTYTLNASSLIGSVNFKAQLYSQLQRVQSLAANTGSTAAIAYTIDWFPTGPTWSPTLPGADVFGIGSAGQMDFTNVICDSNTSGATTALTLQEKIYVPTVPLETGKYAILGAESTALTTNPYNIMRFYHNDFNGYYPGFPCYDQTQFALARGVVDNRAFLMFPSGLQFVAMGECPVFSVTSDGTGLTIATASIAATTPVINVILKKVADAQGNRINLPGSS